MDQVSICADPTLMGPTTSLKRTTINLHIPTTHLKHRYVARNSREVEEKSEQLKAISSLAAIIAGFAVIAFLEFQFTFTDPSHALLPLYGACFAATVRAQRHGAQPAVCCCIARDTPYAGRHVPGPTCALPCVPHCSQL